MNLNTTNLPYILKRLACCIDKFGALLFKSTQIGDKECVKRLREKILVANSYYNILNKYVSITSPQYQFIYNNFSNPSVAVCNIIDLTTNTVLAQAYNTGPVTYPSTIIYSLQTALNTLSTNYPCYITTFDYDETDTLKYINITIANTCSCISNLQIQLYKPVITSPPYTGIQPNNVAISYVKANLINTFIPGNCSNIQCFTSDQLNQLYQQSLDICKDCNCN
jgi:hypothetical protein